MEMILEVVRRSDFSYFTQWTPPNEFWVRMYSQIVQFSVYLLQSVDRDKYARKL